MFLTKFLPEYSIVYKIMFVLFTLVVIVTMVYMASFISYAENVTGYINDLLEQNFVCSEK